MNFVTNTTKNGIIRQDFFSDNYKTNSLTFSFFMPLNKITASNISLLCAVLKRGNARYGEMDKIGAFLEKNYGATLGFSTSKSGELQELAVSLRFIDDRFAIDGEHVSENMVSLLYASLFEPMLENDGFKESFVSQEKQNLKDRIASLVNDKRAYSLERCKNIMFSNEEYGTCELGDIDTVDSITPKSLYEFYNSMLSSAMLFVSYAGFERDTDNLLMPVMKKLDAFQRVPYETKVINEVSSVKYEIEEMNVAQSKLNIGFRLGKTALEDPFAFKMFNVIFGSSPTSKLFMNVREKMSLCYYCASTADSLKNVMFVYSGIETADYEKARDEIFHQLELMKSGDISQEEFDNARAYLIDSYVQTADSLNALISLQTSAVLNGHNLSREQQIEKVKEVTLDRVVRVACDIKTDTVYLLKGIGGGNHAN